MATLRYSPVNALIVDWPFNHCSLPQPLPCEESAAPAGVQCKVTPVMEAPDTYGWDRFLPEVMIAVEDADEAIAANYVREAAIEFARDAKVLQREIVLQLERGETTYPVPSFDFERIEGVIGLDVDEAGSCSGCSVSRDMADYRFDTARSLLHLNRCPDRDGMIRLLVWAVPTEDACVYDSYLYDNFRADLTVGARRNYVLAYHFRDRELVASLPTAQQWRYGILSALKRVRRVPTMSRQTGSSLWGTPRGGHRARGREYWRSW